MYNISSSKDDTTLCQFKISKYCMDFSITYIYIITRHNIWENYRTIGLLSSEE